MRLRIQVPCERAQLAPLLGRIDEALRAHAVGGDVRHDVRLIAEEVVCNAIEHGHDGAQCDPPRQLVVDLARHDDGLHVEFRDDGRPFDPLSHDVPDLDAPLHERPIGGLGVHLVRELAQRVEYERVEPYNVLRVVLRAS